MLQRIRNELDKTGEKLEPVGAAIDGTCLKKSFLGQDGVFPHQNWLHMSSQLFTRCLSFVVHPVIHLDL